MKESKQESRFLTSMDEIEAYTGRSRKMIRIWIERDNFPAIKVDGRWESNTALIDNFREDRIIKLSGKK